MLIHIEVIILYLSGMSLHDKISLILLRLWVMFLYKEKMNISLKVHRNTWFGNQNRVVKA